MTALLALSTPPSRDAQLARVRQTCSKWIDAIPLAERGPLWEVLSRACDRAEILGLNDLAFQTFVKNALRYRRYLQEHEIPESLAFTTDTVEDYQLYVARLRKTRSVPPAHEGKPLTHKPKPVRRAAVGDEPRLAIGTQKDIVDAVRLLWKAAKKCHRTQFTDFPLTSPTADLEWRDEEKRDPVRIELDLPAMLSVPFVPARGRSRCEFERNLLLAHFYAAIPTRNTELREAVWEALQVWEIAPGAALPLRRWPLEALLCGEVALDEAHVLFVTLGGAVPTKSDTYRSVPLVGDLAERAVAYALAWVQGQLGALKYLRYRARTHLAPGPLRAASFDQRALELLIDGRRLSVHELEQSFALFKEAHALSGPGVLKWTNVLHTLTPAEAAALRDLLWADAAATRYGAALRAFATKTPIREVFAGVFLGSREGGVLGDKPLQFIWREQGWTANGWTPQHLRAHAAQLFEGAYLEALRPLRRVIGHQRASTTRANYTGETPFADVVVAEMIAERLTNPGHCAAGLLHEPHADARADTSAAPSLGAI